MGIRLSGSHAALDSWRRKLRATDGLMRSVSQDLSEEALTLVSKGFRQKQDPYGGKWAPRVSGKSGSSLLVKTGALRNSFHAEDVNETGFTIASGVEYAQYHQNGTGRMVARQMLPDEGDLPGKWEKAFDGVVEDVLDDFFGE